MPKTFSERLKHFICGKPRPYPRAATERLFKMLSKLGFAPGHIVDIGGNRGYWTSEARAAFPNANITMFEPLVELSRFHASLGDDPKIEIVYKGVGDIDGAAAFTIHDRDDSSSFIHSSEVAAQRGHEQREAQIVRLDTYLETSRFGPPDLIKIDAEGFDLKVVEGATLAIRHAEIVLVEAGVSHGILPNTVLAVLRKMDDLGYRLLDITDLNRTPELGALWLIEGVFVRKGSRCDTGTRSYT